MALDAQGRLVIASFAGRSIDRIEPNGERTVLADSYDGKRFNGTNDVVVKKDGGVYFTDMFGALRLGDKDPSMGLPYQAVYMVKNGKVTRVTDDIPPPTVSRSRQTKNISTRTEAGKYIRRYDVNPDGTLANSQMLIDMNADTAPGITDGMKVDTLGNIYSSGPGGIWIVAPDGKHIGTIRTPESVTNLAFGGADKRTLYITARPTIYKIPVRVPGF